MSLELGALRTYGRLDEWYTKLQEDAARSRNPETFVKRNQKNYMNVVHPSLLKRELETTILSDVPLPELHLMMGVVNWVVELLYKLVLVVEGIITAGRTLQPPIGSILTITEIIQGGGNCLAY